MLYTFLLEIRLFAYLSHVQQRFQQQHFWSASPFLEIARPWEEIASKMQNSGSERVNKWFKGCTHNLQNERRKTKKLAERFDAPAPDNNSEKRQSKRCL